MSGCSAKDYQGLQNNERIRNPQIQKENHLRSYTYNETWNWHFNSPIIDKWINKICLNSNPLSISQSMIKRNWAVIQRTCTANRKLQSVISYDVQGLPTTPEKFTIKFTFTLPVLMGLISDTSPHIWKKVWNRWRIITDNSNWNDLYTCMNQKFILFPKLNHRSSPMTDGSSNSISHLFLPFVCSAPRNFCAYI